MPLFLSCEVNTLGETNCACVQLIVLNEFMPLRRVGKGVGGGSSGIMLNYSLVEDLEVGPESKVNRAGEADSQSASTRFTLGHLSCLSDSDNKQRPEPSEPPLQE